jgi:hypothetical protein
LNAPAAQVAVGLGDKDVQQLLASAGSGMFGGLGKLKAGVDTVFSVEVRPPRGVGTRPI